MNKIKTLPNNDILIANSKEIRIISDSNQSTLKNIPDINSLKCLDWTHMNKQHVLALGYTSGKTSLGLLDNDELNIVNQFEPRHARSCIDLSFSPLDSKLLASGLEKVRNDYGLLIWDISMTETAARPLFQFGPSEGISSLSWFHSKNRIVAGMSQRWIRVFDLRVDARSSIAPIVINSRSVFGIVTDPFHEHRFASYGEDSIIKVYDIRKPTDSLVSFPAEFRNGLGQMAWSPLRSGLLATCGKDSNVLKVWDIYDITLVSILNSGSGVGSVSGSGVGSAIGSVVGTGKETEKETKLQETDVEPILTNVYKLKQESQEPIACFCWSINYQNPQDFYQRIFILSPSSSFDTLLLSVTHPMAWSPSNMLSFAASQNVANLDCLDLIQKDIVHVMKERALQGYGLDIVKNINILRNNEELRNCWIGIDTIQSQISLGYSWGDYNWTGLYIFLLETLSSKDETLTLNRLSWPCYLNEVRKKGLVMIGWDFYKHDFLTLTTMLESLLQELEDNKEYERAASLAFFHGQSVTRAIECLNKSNMEKHKLLAIALSGFSNPTSLWRNLCSSLLTDLKDSYLRSIFSLIASDGDWNTVLNEKDLNLRDKLALGLLFLSDSELLSFLLKITNKYILLGNLEGFLLTGWSPFGFQLLQQYLDNTNDVQTVALLTLMNNPFKDRTFSLGLQWIDSYRDLLDCWEMYSNRVKLDIQNQNLDKTAQLYIKCTFCGNTLMNDGLSGCPKCKKPLPRCALCLLHMGQPLPDSKNPCDDWFSFCIQCQHGGHALHISEWFDNHLKCPVSDCECLCFSV